MAGQYNSSITRVRPVFKQLIYRENTKWIADILRLSPVLIAQDIATNIGNVLPHNYEKRPFQGTELEACFEASLPPADEFLRWLIENPTKMTWCNVKTSDSTTAARKELFVGSKKREAEALAALKQYGAEGSAKKWWAFEGFTEVDCLIETDTVLLGIEGKRTEEGPSASVSWYPHRNQIIRNLEVVKQRAGNKPFGVFLVDEKGDYQIDRVEIRNSLPHFTQQDQDSLMQHFLGTITWRQLCEATGLNYDNLPDRITDVQS